MESRIGHRHHAAPSTPREGGWPLHRRGSSRGRALSGGSATGGKFRSVTLALLREAGRGSARALIALFVLLGCAVLSGAPTLTRADDGDKSVLGGLLSRALSTPSSRVAIGAVDGALSSDATIRDVAVGDRDGVWLKLDRARIVWRRLALLSGRLEVDSLEIGRLEVLRRPVPGPTPPEAKPDGKLLPDLPVKVEIKGFKLAELVLGEPVAGQPARLSAEGKARLGAASEGLDLQARAQRLDAAGRFLLTLLYVPNGDRLELKANLIEPAGGLLSKAAGIPGTPPIDFDLAGTGMLDAWTAKLDFAAGPEIGAKGGAKISRIGAERRLALDLAARIEGLVPGPAASVFAGTTKLDGGLAFADSGAFRIDRLELTSRTARLAAGGSLTRDRVADLTLQARALPTEGAVTKAGEAEIGMLVFDGSLKGAITAPTIRGNLDAAGLRSRESGLDRIEAHLGVAPQGDPAAQRFAITADGTVEGLRLADPALRRAVGSRAQITLRAASGPDGVIDISTLRLDSETARASYAGRVGQNTLTGTVDAALPDLAVFSGLAGRGLAGSLDAKARLNGDPARKALAADLTVTSAGLATGIAAADRVLGRAPSLQGRLAQSYDGYGFDHLRLEGAGLTATLQGEATSSAADVTGRLDLKSLADLDGRLTGRAGIDARMTGSLEHPQIAATLTAPAATADGKPIRNLRAEALLSDALLAPDGTLRLSGDVAGKVLTGGAHLARTGADWVLDRLSVDLGSVAVEGSATVAADSWLTAGSLSVRAGNLDDIAPLAPEPMAGRLDAAVTLSRDGGRQDAAIRATGAALRYGAYALTRLDADLRGRDLRAHPVLDGRLEADRLLAAGQQIDAVRLAANGSPAGSDVTLTAKSRGFGLDGAVRIVPADDTRIEIQRLSAARGSDRFALTGPATVTLRDGGAEIDGLSIGADSGRVTVTGRAGRDLDLRVAIRALPLSLARIAAPDLALSGTLDGEADLHGSAARPEGRYALTVSKLVTPQTRQAGLPPVDASAKGTLADGKASLDGRVTAGRGVALTVAGSLPVETGGPLDIRARGTLDASLANSLLSVGGQSVAGRIAIDGGVTGTLAAPRAQGSAALTGGRFNDPLNGIRLTDIDGRVTGRGDSLVVERLTAATRNGGRLSVTGRVALEPDFPGQFHVTADKAELVSSPLMTAVSSVDLTLAGPLVRTPRVAGRIDVVSIDVAVPDRLPATIRPLPGVRHVNTPPDARVRLAQRADRKAAAAPSRRPKKPAVPFDATLDVRVDAPSRIFVRGRGIDAELGGSLRVTGTSRAPNAVGAFAMRRGRLELVGQRLDFSRGRLTFAGSLTTPDLDFAAETKAGDVTARVAVSGPADAPQFALTSDPVLPQDEILSRLLFKKAAGGLSPFQALQLAQAVAQLSGGASGPDVFEQARKGLGLDSLDVSTGASGGPALGASRYISDRVSVGVKAGAKPADTAVGVDFDVTRRIKLKGEAGSDGRTSLGVGAEYEW
ncbi:translocation/assembly module TamB domain-containing protein [Methylobacterium sp. NEAU K]|uniref:translocation/assembly module TamB domain-containing protein n=1 Tax=Methylobacterium sp. NEAU K TaxID=3064946 RepID=UPI002735255B|nr:translocation/assembly module TamB domain-containing protein [Methylobacterium sp. NEAU K]MDP4003130.1 translocation/assembly module TamB domain-containing protein [Methylobacterium sp. NEAU K]